MAEFPEPGAAGPAVRHAGRAAGPLPRCHVRLALHRLGGLVQCCLKSLIPMEPLKVPAAG